MEKTMKEMILNLFCNEFWNINIL